MTEKIYCSQCHKSVYVATCHTTDAKNKFGNDKICLYCLKKGKFFPKNKEIKGCTDLMPESVDKLMQGVWVPNSWNNTNKH